MDNNFSDGHHNMENEKNDEETREPSFQKDMSSLIKDNLDDKDQVKNTQSCIEKEENVAENVEEVHNIEDNNNINPKADSEDDHSLNIDSESLTFSNSDKFFHNDDIDSKERNDIKQPRRPSLEPSIPRP
jgi:hypothetical protein